MTNGPDEQRPGQEPPPPPPPPPSGGGRGLFARNDPDQPGPPPRAQQPPREEPPRRQPDPPREDPRARQQQPPADPDENPFLLPNERDRMPVYGAAPPLPVVPLVLMVLAIVIGGALIFMSMGDKKETGITPQQASSSLVLHMDGLDITEDAFRREIATGISKGRIPCDRLAGQPADNIAAGLRLGALKMEVPSASGVAPKNGQKADDASLLIAGQVVVDSCPKGAAPAPGQQPQTNPPGGNPAQPGGNPPGGTTNPPGGTNPAPAGTQAPAPGGNAPAPGGNNPAPATTPAPGGNNPAPAGTPRPTTPAPPAAPGR